MTLSLLLLPPLVPQRIRPFFSIIADDGQLVVSAASCCNHQDNPADEGDEPQPVTHEAKKGDVTEHGRPHAHDTEEDEGLHRVEAHKAILPLKQEEDQAGDPATKVAQPTGKARSSTHRDPFRRTAIPCRRSKVRLLVPIVLLRAIELLLLLISSLSRRVIALSRAWLYVVGSLQRLRCGRSSVSTIGSICFV